MFRALPDGTIYASPEAWGWVAAMMAQKIRTDSRTNGGFSPLGLEFIDAATLAAHTQFYAARSVPQPEPAPAGFESVWISASEAAARRGCSDGLIRRMARLGQLPAQKVGKTWLIDESALDKGAEQ